MKFHPRATAALGAAAVALLIACDGNPTGQPPKPDPVPVADTEPPAAVLATRDTATAVGTITVRGSATDNVKVTRVTYWSGGDPPREIPITPGKSVEFQVAVGLPEAAATINVVAYDSAGNVSATQTVQVIYDRTSPFARAFPPAFAAAAMARVLVYAYDWNGNGPGYVSRVTYAVNGGAEAPATRVQTQASPPRASFVADVPLRDGANEVTFYVYDHAGNSAALPRQITRGAAATSVSVGGGFACAAFADGVARCWGDNGDGQLGIGAAGEARKPGPVSGGQHFVSLTAGYMHACGLTPTGNAWCWGNLVSGPSQQERNVVPQPQRVAGNVVFTQLSAGWRHTCGLDADGAAWCWGDNGIGQLGDGGTLGSTTPVRVVGNLRFETISAGSSHTCAITAAGDAYCWGNNFRGQGGTGTSSIAPVPDPRAVLGGLKFRSISAGTWHTCAVTVDDAGYCWGFEEFGLLGSSQAGGYSVRTTPLAVDGGLRFRSISAGTVTCGVTVGGEAFCWGDSHNDALGTVFNPGWPMRDYEPVPVRAAPGMTFDAVSSRWGTLTGSFACASEQGSVLCWGQSEGYRLGW